MTETSISALPQVAKTIDEYPEIFVFSDPARVFIHARDETRPEGNRTVIISLATLASQLTLTQLTSQEIFLVFTASVAAGTPLNVNASGVGYTYAGATAIDLGASAAEFNSNSFIEVNRNGVEMSRGSEVIWVSSTQIMIMDNVIAGEQVSIQITEG